MESLHDCEGRLACKGNPKTGYVESLYKGSKTSTTLAVGEVFTIECQGVVTNIIRTCTAYFTVVREYTTTRRRWYYAKAEFSR